MLSKSFYLKQGRLLLVSNLLHANSLLLAKPAQLQALAVF